MKDFFKKNKGTVMAGLSGAGLVLVVLLIGIVGFSFLGRSGSYGVQYNGFADSGGYYTEGISVSNSLGSMKGDVAYDSSMPGSYEYDTVDQSTSGFDITDIISRDPSQKWIVTSRLSVEAKDYDGLMQDVLSALSKYNGWAEDSNEGVRQGYSDGYHKTNDRRYASMTIRIPTADLDAFLLEIGKKGEIVSKTKNLENITLEYSDTETWKRSLEAERDRLLELMEQAETVDELISIEDRLTNVKYQLERAESTLRRYDDKIEFATLYLTITEVVHYSSSPVGFFGKVGEDFVQNMQDTWYFVLDSVGWFLSHIPGMATFVVFCTVVVMLFKIWRKRRKAKRTKRVGGDITGPSAPATKPADPQA